MTGTATPRLLVWTPPSPALSKRVEPSVPARRTCPAAHCMQTRVGGDVAVSLPPPPPRKREWGVMAPPPPPSHKRELGDVAPPPPPPPLPPPLHPKQQPQPASTHPPLCDPPPRRLSR